MSEQHDDLRLSDDGTIDIEASAEGRKPRIRTTPAYSGGKLDIAWTHNGERLPVVVDIETLEAGSGLPFVLNHRLDQPVGTIESITKTASEIIAEGSFTHGHTLYGAAELTAAKNGFKHRPSVTVYSPDPKNVIRVGQGERLFINGRWQDGEFFAVKNGKLRNIAIVSTPGDPGSDNSGVILAQAQGEKQMTEELNVEHAAEAHSNVVSEPVQDIHAGASVQNVPLKEPAAKEPPAKAHVNYAATIEKMYERGDLSADIMASALENGWTPKQALDANTAVAKIAAGLDGSPNVAGFPNTGTTGKRNEPNRDMIMAAAFLMEHCGFEPSDFDSAQNKKAVLKLDERTIDAATAGEWRGIRFSDLCAHAADAFYNGNAPKRKRMSSRQPMEYFEACVNSQPQIDAKIDFEYADDIKADADTGLSTIGLRNIWALINTATIGKAYDGVPTIWQDICKKASVSNFLKHTVHRVEMVGDFQRLSRLGEEPPHLTYMESQTESQIDTWGAMLTLSRKDIINDEVGVFTDAAARIGRKAAEKLEQECFSALIQDGTNLFSAAHKNKLTGATSAFSFDALDKAFDMFYSQKSPGGTPIMVHPAFLLIPSTLRFSVQRLLSMGTEDGSPKGKQNLYENFPFKFSQFLKNDNGLYIIEGSKRTPVPGSDTGWYLFANPSDMPVIVATFLNGKTKPTIERANMRFSLDGLQYKAVIDFEFITSEFRGGVYATGV